MSHCSISTSKSKCYQQESLQKYHSFLTVSGQERLKNTPNYQSLSMRKNYRFNSAKIYGEEESSNHTPVTVRDMKKKHSH